MKSAHQNAFTLVELLVVIAIIAVFMAMMLPAVQASRETARRTECNSNLIKLIVGVHHYQDAHEYYPPGVIDDHGPIHSVAEGKHQNWMIQLLPYVDQLPMYKHVDQAAGVYASPNAAVRQMRLSVLLCPSDISEDSPVGVSNYAACHHDVEAPIDADNHGVFFLNSRLRYEDISDGTSHTIFLGEKLAEPNDLGWMSGTRATLRNTGTSLNAKLLSMMFPHPPSSSAIEESPPPAENGAEARSAEKPEAEAITAPALEVKTTSSATAAEKSDPTLYVGGFDCRHPTGVNFAFGDGSVRFIPEMISQQVLQQLGNRADGQLLNAPY